MNKAIVGVIACSASRRRGRRLLVRQQRNGRVGAGRRQSRLRSGGHGKVGRGAGRQPRAAVTVEAIKVATAPMPQTITAVGSLRSDESVTLRPEVAGRISAIGFQEGQRVAKGAMLVRLDPAINEAEVQQAQRQPDAREGEVRSRRRPREAATSSRARRRTRPRTTCKVAEAALQLAEARLAKTEIRAPFSGIIGLRSVSVGDYVKEGADIVNLESIDPLKVDFRVPEVYMRQVQVGQTLEDRARRAARARRSRARCSRSTRCVDAAGRSIVIRAQVRNQDTSAAPGHVRARAAHHQGRARRAGRARAGARAAGRRAVRVQGRRRQGGARRRSRSASAATARSRSCSGVAPDDIDRHRRPAEAPRRRAGDASPGKPDDAAAAPRRDGNGAGAPAEGR